MLTALGRGYHRQITPDQEASLEKVRAEAVDPKPLLNAYPMFFHQLCATAEELVSMVEVDARESPDGYQDWYSTIKSDFTKKATKAAAAEVEEKWLSWKASQIDRCAAAHENEIAAKVREKGKNYLIEQAGRLGLHISHETNPADTPNPPLTTRKHTASGSAPKEAQPVPPSPRPTRITPPCAAKCSASISLAWNEREVSAPLSQVTCHRPY